MIIEGSQQFGLDWLRLVQGVETSFLKKTRSTALYSNPLIMAVCCRVLMCTSDRTFSVCLDEQIVRKVKARKDRNHNVD